MIEARAPDWTAASCGAGAIAVELLGVAGGLLAGGAWATPGVVPVGVVVVLWPCWTTGCGALWCVRRVLVGVVAVGAVVVWVVGVVEVVVVGVVAVEVGVVVEVVLGVVATGASAGVLVV